MSYYNKFNPRKLNTVKTPPRNSKLRFFIDAFKKRLGRTPNEYINEKLKNGSRFEDVKYLFNIVAAEISNQNNCEFFEFDYFYKNEISSEPQPITKNFHKSQHPANAGKYWTAEEEQLLIKMYHSNASKEEMCNTFKRTENGLAARLVHLGIIKDRDVFRGKK